MSSTASKTAEFYSQAARNYEKANGGVTKKQAVHVIAMLPTITSESIILDNACGPAIITREILDQFSKNVAASSSSSTSSSSHPPTIHATDNAQGMVDAVESFKEQNNWTTVHPALMSGQDLQFADNTFTHSVSNFGIFLFPDWRRGLTEAYRTLQPGGTLALSSWHKLGYLPSFRKAYHDILGHDAAPFVMPISPGWFEVDTVKGYLEEAGFENVVCLVKKEFAVLETGGEFADYVMSRMIRSGILGKELQELDEERFQRFIAVFKEDLEKVLGTDEQGRRLMEMDALIASGVKPHNG